MPEFIVILEEALDDENYKKGPGHGFTRFNKITASHMADVVEYFNYTLSQKEKDLLLDFRIISYDQMKSIELPT